MTAEKKKLTDTNYLGRFLELDEAAQSAVVEHYNNVFVTKMEPRMSQQQFVEFLSNVDNSKPTHYTVYKELLAQILPKNSKHSHA